MIFDKCKNSKEQGNIGLSYSINYFVKKRYTVSIPLNDSQDYDLIVDISPKGLCKIQIKTTGFKTESGNFKVDFRSSGGSKGEVYKRVVDTDIDYVFVLTSNEDMYLLPLSIIGTNSATLGDKYLDYKL